MRAPGFHEDVPEADYHAERGSLSVSGAKTLLKAPALYRWQLDHPVHRDVFDYGSAAHTLVLGVGASILVCPFDSWRSKDAQQMRDDARAKGETPLLTADYERVVGMADALTEHTYAVSLLTGGAAEVSASAIHEPTGVLRRCRYDYIRRGELGVDYKSAATAEPVAFANACARYGYDMQAAWYLDVAADLGERLEAFAFIAQEKEPPYLVEVYELPDELLARGHRRNTLALERFRDCTDSGIWPGYTGLPYSTLPTPNWTRFEDQ